MAQLESAHETAAVLPSITEPEGSRATAVPLWAGFPDVNKSQSKQWFDGGRYCAIAQLENRETPVGAVLTQLFRPVQET